MADSDPSKPPDLHAVETEPEVEFDFAAHRQRAVEAYQALHPVYEEYARVVYSIMRTCLDRAAIKVSSIEHRAKDPESFGRKAELADPDYPARPKYRSPLVEIMDLAGVRVITFFLSTEERVDEVISAEFDVLEKTDKTALLEQEERLGYHSIHYIVALRDSRLRLPEYEQFDGLRAEIQVRTILQHAWAEIEHDIQYKAVSALPAEIRRRFMSLAGMLEIADREFQALEAEDKRLRAAATASVEAGRLEEVEITPEALKTYLDRKFGPDGRMTNFSYWWEARVLTRLGFSTLRQVDNAISSYDADELSRTIHGRSQGQLTRLEDVLLAAMGDEFVRRHPWTTSEDGDGEEDDWASRYMRERLERLRHAQLKVGEYRPEHDRPSRPTRLARS